MDRILSKLGFNFQASSPDLIEDRSAYFAEYRVALEAAKDALSDGDIAADDDDDVSAVTVTEGSQPIAVDALPASAKAIFAAATALGWVPRAWRTRTLHQATIFKSTTEDHNAGDIRFPAKSRRNYFLTGKLPAGRLGFTALWSGIDDLKMQQAWDDRPFMSALWLKAVPKDPAEQKTGGFLTATIFDPYGISVELKSDYQPSKYQSDTFGKIKANYTSEHRSYDYNDGAEVDQFSKFVGNATEFTAWLDEWLTMLAPEHKKLSKALKVKEPARPVDLGLDLLTNGSWESA